MTTDVHPRENCIAPDMYRIVFFIYRESFSVCFRGMAPGGSRRKGSAGL